MENIEFKEIAKTLSNALIDDFRGFLIQGIERLEVPEDLLHFQVAMQELEKNYNWKHESGAGQNPIIEYMLRTKAIYITKIPVDVEKEEYQRAIGYIADLFAEEIEYNGTKEPAKEIIKRIAISLGYDVDEYIIKEMTEDFKKISTEINHFKGDVYIKKAKVQQIPPHRQLSNGDKPVFSSDGKLQGFISNGKFVNARNYRRYSKLSSKKDEAKDSDDVKTL